MNKMKKIKCLLGFHKYEDIKTQVTKNMAFGFSGCEMPGYRIVQKCKLGVVEENKKCISLK